MNDERTASVTSFTPLDNITVISNYLVAVVAAIAVVRTLAYTFVRSTYRPVVSVPIDHDTPSVAFRVVFARPMFSGPVPLPVQYSLLVVAACRLPFRPVWRRIRVAWFVPGP